MTDIRLIVDAAWRETNQARKKEIESERVCEGGEEKPKYTGGPGFGELTDEQHRRS